MKKTVLYVCIVLLVMVGIIGISCAQPTPTPAPTPTPTPAPEPVKTINWKMQSFTPSTSDLWMNCLEPFVKLVDEKSNGQLKIELFNPGAIVPQPEVGKALAEGVFEAALGPPAFDVGIIPEAYVVSGLPFYFKDSSQQLEFWYEYEDGLAFKMVQDAYAAKGRFEVAIVVFDEPMCIMTMFPVSKVSDFQGKKIRATGAHAAAIKALGAEQVNMQLADVYTGLQTGVIDGVFMATSGLYSFKWAEVVKYVIKPAWMHCSPQLIEVNLGVWNNLSPDLQKVVQDSAREAILDHLIPAEVEIVPKLVSDAMNKYGVKEMTLPPAEAEKYKNATKVLWDYAEGQSPENAKLVQMEKAFLDEKGVSYPGK